MQREREKKRKADEKRQRKLDKKARAEEAVADPTADGEESIEEDVGE